MSKYMNNNFKSIATNSNKQTLGFLSKNYQISLLTKFFSNIPFEYIILDS